MRTGLGILMKEIILDLILETEVYLGLVVN